LRIQRCEESRRNGGQLSTLNRMLNSITNFSDFSVDRELSNATLAQMF
jgi:hypothetical protein